MCVFLMEYNKQEVSFCVCGIIYFLLPLLAVISYKKSNIKFKVIIIVKKRENNLHK